MGVEGETLGLVSTEALGQAERVLNAFSGSGLVASSPFAEKNEGWGTLSWSSCQAGTRSRGSVFSGPDQCRH
jgi:hypothetical protein